MKIHRTWHNLTLCAAMALMPSAFPQPAMAQLVSHSDSVHHRNDCRKAARIMETGHPAGKKDWAFGYIASCGAEGSRAVAAAMRAARFDTDIDRLDRVTTLALYFRGAEVFSAAMEIAGDPAASTPARVFAVRSLLYQLDPLRRIQYSDLIPSTEWIVPDTCLGGLSTHSLATEGTPLPPDYQDQMEALGRTLQADQSLSPEVRAASQCLIPANSQ